MKSAVETLNPTRAKLTVTGRTDAWSPDNFALDWKGRSRNGGELTLVYEGPLAKGNTVAVRYGTWREGGQPWEEIQEVTLKQEGAGRFTGKLTLREGRPLQAVQLALRAGDDRWDNGGRAPMGYYEWRPGETRLTTRPAEIAEEE